MPDPSRGPKGGRGSSREVLGWIVILGGLLGYGIHHDVVALGLTLTTGAAVLDVQLPGVGGPS